MKSKVIFLLFLFINQLAQASINFCEVDDTITTGQGSLAGNNQEIFNQLLQVYKCPLEILELNGFYPRRIERIQFVVSFEWRGGISYRQLYQCTHSIRFSPDRKHEEDLGHLCVQLTL